MKKKYDDLTRVQSLLNKIESIYIDTSVLMNPPQLSRFINNYESEFIANRKMIIVPTSVYLELLRLSTSKSADKAFKAKAGINSINDHSDLFLLEQADYDSEDLGHAFADPELLTMLTKDRRYKKQLLITNDRNLSCDAYELNTTHSFHGKEIYVYYVNIGGYLRPCCFDEEITLDPKPLVQTTICDTNTPMTSNATEDSTHISKYIGISVLSFALGVGATILGINIASSRQTI